MPPATRPVPPPLLQRSDLAAADAVGALMELWGFRRQLGRAWAVLFLSDRPLAAPELCARLEISTGLLSMTLAELRRALGTTQQELEAVVKMSQSELSKTERRTDHRVSTLRRIVHALGGRLEIVAHIGDKRIRLVET